ncbi:hypothetical protein LCM10_18240 [Rossellomorea aquimaris]|uniref:hypothetical protein n=1 Tax=Rossellomorea aquimaris TaxID=189382 RepID=UPI001CD7967E|nr:hypothetical protein [Rossellomorea aquimaris]MCA1056909.1 hypothetical protein [Rossellomorea aquimaris]
MCTTNRYFTFDNRLKIDLPRLEKDWSFYSSGVREAILFDWERIRGQIPDRIAEIETEIEELQDALGREEDFEESFRLNHEISERASEINDLWLWYRTRPDL